MPSWCAFDGAVIYFTVPPPLRFPPQLGLVPFPDHFWSQRCFSNYQRLRPPVTFRLEIFRLTAPTVVMCLIWCWARVGVPVWDLFCKYLDRPPTRCDIHRGPCLHTSDDARGTGLGARLHNGCWLCLEPF